jgi:putative peptidoglycan lipid II flippase
VTQLWSFARAVATRVATMKSARRAAFLAVISALARAPGLLIPILIAAYYGAGPKTDAYFIVYSTALFIGGTAAQGIEVAIVPFAARAITSGSQGARRFLDGTAFRASAAAGLAWLVGVPIAVWVSQEGLQHEVASYGALFAPLVILWNASSVYSGGLVSQDAIGLAIGSAAWRGAGGILAVVLAPADAGLGAVPIGLAGGELARAWWLRDRLLKRVPETAGMLQTGSPPFGPAATAQVLAGAAGGSVGVAERFLAATLGSGAVSHLEYASKLLVIPGLVFDGALAPLLLARWSHSVAARGEVPARAEVVRVLGKGMGVALAIAALIYAFAGDAVQLFLHHGRFMDADAIAVSSLLRVLALGYVGSMGAVLLERYYLARAKNRLLAALSVARLLLRVSTALLLLPRFGLLAFGFGFAAAEYGYLTALLVSLPSTPITPDRSGATKS